MGLNPEAGVHITERFRYRGTGEGHVTDVGGRDQSDALQAKELKGLLATPEAKRRQRRISP